MQEEEEPEENPADKRNEDDPIQFSLRGSESLLGSAALSVSPCDEPSGECRLDERMVLRSDLIAQESDLAPECAVHPFTLRDEPIAPLAQDRDLGGYFAPNLCKQPRAFGGCVDLHHGLPRWARWLPIRLEDLSKLPSGARVLLLE